jgi:hypothetical protein
MLYLMGSAQTICISRCWVPHLWLTSTGAPYYIQRAEWIDQVLLSIKPPNEIRRTPRSIAKFLYVLKASEHRNWLLFYSPIALKGILSGTYYKHWLRYW